MLSVHDFHEDFDFPRVIDVLGIPRKVQYFAPLYNENWFVFLRNPCPNCGERYDKEETMCLGLSNGVDWTEEPAMLVSGDILIPCYNCGCVNMHSRSLFQ